jgi:hypothetical protein
MSIDDYKTRVFSLFLDRFCENIFQRMFSTFKNSFPVDILEEKLGAGIVLGKLFYFLKVSAEVFFKFRISGIVNAELILGTYRTCRRNSHLLRKIFMCVLVDGESGYGVIGHRK